MERPQLTKDEIIKVKQAAADHFAKKKEEVDGRVEFIEAAAFKGRKHGYYWGRGSGTEARIGYHMDYAQMRHLMKLDVGDRCEARYAKVRKYFRGVICNANDDDCSYDVRFEHGPVSKSNY